VEEFVALLTLTNVLNYLKVQKVDILKVCVARPLTDIYIDDSPQLTEKFGLAKVKEMLNDIVNSCYDSAVEKQKAEGCIVLERGLATIPLAGLDVLFHSRYLWSDVMPFRPSGDVTELLLTPA